VSTSEIVNILPENDLSIIVYDYVKLISEITLNKGNGGQI